jgi:hypothetical protein
MKRNFEKNVSSVFLYTNLLKVSYYFDASFAWLWDHLFVAVCLSYNPRKLSYNFLFNNQERWCPTATLRQKRNNIHQGWSILEISGNWLADFENFAFYSGNKFRTKKRKKNMKHYRLNNFYCLFTQYVKVITKFSSNLIQNI